MSLEQYVIAVLRGERKGLFVAIVKVFLFLLSLLYELAIGIRSWLYKKHYFRSRPSPLPTISVGNISAGGVGKTPVTLALLKDLTPRYKVGVILRGYRSQSERYGKTVTVSEGEGPLCTAVQCGDEAFMIAKRYPDAIVVVGKDRFKAIQQAQILGAQIIVLDDAFQHRKIERDVDLVVLDATDPWGGGYCLPRGFLREPISALARANLVLFNHTEGGEVPHYLVNRVQKYSSAPILAANIEVSGVYSSSSIQEVIENKRVGFYCGIGNPAHALSTAKGLGAQIVAERFFPDHLAPLDELVLFAQDCKDQGAELILCTEKDFVRLDEPSLAGLPVWYIQIDLKVTGNKQAWDVLVDSIGKY